MVEADVKKKINYELNNECVSQQYVLILYFLNHMIHSHTHSSNYGPRDIYTV